MSRRRQVILGLLGILLLSVTLNHWLQGVSGTRWLLQGAAALVSGELTVSEITRRDDVLVLSGLRYRDAGAALAIGELELRWRPWRLLTASLVIERLHGRDIALQLREGEPAPPGEQFQGLTLPLRLVLQDGRLDGLQITRPAAEPLLIDHLALSASHWWRSFALDTFRVEALGAQLQVAGELHTTAPFPLQLTGSWHSRHPAQQLTGTLTLGGSLEGLDARGQLAITGGEADGISANWQARYAGGRLAPHITVTQQGGEGTIELDGEVGWQDAPLHFRLDGRMHALTWPPAKPSARLDEGTLSLSGNTEAYQLNATAVLSGAQLPPSRWQLQGSGDTRHFNAESLQGELLEGHLKASGELWRGDGWQWQAQLEANKINPAAQWPEWPGSLSGSATINGSYGNGLTLRLAPLTLAGQLRGQPLSLQSNASLQGENLTLKQLALQFGDSALKANLTLGKALQGELTLHAPNLERLWPDATGSVELQLQASGPRQQPYLKAQYQAKEVAIEGYAIASLQGELDLDLAGGHPWRIDARAAGVSPGVAELGPLTLALHGSGNAAEHRLSLSAADGKRTLHSALEGGWQQPRWQGQLTRLDLHDPMLGEWRLAAAAPLELAADEVRLDNGCLNSNPASLCLSYLREATSSQRLQLALKAFDLSRLKPLSEEYATLELPLEAQLDVTLPPAATPSGEGRITLGSGTIKPTSDIPTLASTPIRLKAGELLLHARQGVVEGEGQLRLVSGDLLHGTAQLTLGTDWREQLAQQPLAAQLGAELHELQLLELLIPQLDGPRGSMTGELKVSGNLVKPQLTGRVELAMSQCQLPQLGLTLRDTQLTAKSEQPGHLSVNASASSGKGQLHAEGWFAVEGAKGWRSELRLQGEQFEVSHIPEAQVTVSPQLLLRAAPLQLDVSGEVRLDEARLEPQDLALVKTPSSDVVIVEPEGSVEAAPRWAIHSDIRLIADDTLRLKGFGFEGYLGGNLRIIDEEKRPPRAQGELHLVPGASYRAFGQDLKAEHGRLYFADTPLDNPNLDISATRQVGDVVAGVQVAGTARQPQLTLFSRPTMEQTDILSYLTLGRPFSRAGVNDGNTMMQAANSAGLAGGDYLLGRIGSRFNLEEARIESGSSSGEPWLVLGRYLSPRLYVRYGVGLMESGRSVIMRYQLSDHWSLQGEGGRASGADLLYTIERP